MKLDRIDPKVTVALLLALTASALVGVPASANGTSTQHYDRSESSPSDYYERGEYDEDTQRRLETLQDTPGLTQQSNLIGSCRYSPDSLDVFADAGRVERLLTIAPNTAVTLTGVVGNGIAEIRYPAQGWISTLTVETCSNGTTPPPTPEPETFACYRTLTNVTVRTNPSINARALGYIRTGGIAYPTTNPPNNAVSGDGRTWIEIDDFLGDDGWIAITGANGSGTNVEGLPQEECDRQ